ncbi:nucleotide exchange factor GrpE [Actinomycetospora chibensis]|uniref:Nucleotide exchange factor GrpE n=1 Tax=Actinomycetospora chibensis TaxID=663606 RepID=A0ABV9RI80_9PSEU|nr:nucleotide exchange factor GrpE [Actinomycetospora chibensis]MDD7927614.1 nucleotide exchange factor GrpE [Actinomycetospora chibensis]
MSHRNRSRRRPRATAAAMPADSTPESFLGALAATRVHTAKLVRGMDAHRAHSEEVLREINRHELDTKRMLDGLARVLDACHRLLDDKTETDVERYRASVRRVSGLLDDLLSNHSRMELIGRTGEIADPETHEVIEVRDDGATARDTVLKVVDRGIRFRGELLRPASVIVSSGKDPSA